MKKRLRTYRPGLRDVVNEKEQPTTADQRQNHPTRPPAWRGRGPNATPEALPCGIEGAEEHTEGPLRHSVRASSRWALCPFGLAEAEENPDPQPDVVLNVCS